MVRNDVKKSNDTMTVGENGFSSHWVFAQNLYNCITVKSDAVSSSPGSGQVGACARNRVGQTHISMCAW